VIVTETQLPGIRIIEPDVFVDNRGFFLESYSSAKLADLGIADAFVQDNHSFSRKAGTLRGLHYQREPRAQTKIIRCTRGRILDVIVDIREGSPTYCKWVSMELSADNFRQVYVPAGFAHGFLSLTDDVEIHYKTSDYFASDCDRCILWSDPAIGVCWGIENPILSDKDRNAPLLCDSDCNFIWEAETAKEMHKS